MGEGWDIEGQNEDAHEAPKASEPGRGQASDRSNRDSNYEKITVGILKDGGMKTRHGVVCAHSSILAASSSL